MISAEKAYHKFKKTHQKTKRETARREKILEKYAWEIVRLWKIIMDDADYEFRDLTWHGSVSIIMADMRKHDFFSTSEVILMAKKIFTQQEWSSKYCLRHNGMNMDLVEGMRVPEDASR